MARPKKTDAPNLAERQHLTVGTIDRLSCPTASNRHSCVTAKAALRVRVTAAGAKSFVFESKLNRQTIRRTIGDVLYLDNRAGEPKPVGWLWCWTVGKTHASLNVNSARKKPRHRLLLLPRP